MNLLRKIFGESQSASKDTRREWPVKRMQAATDRLDAAADDLCKTVRLSCHDFRKMLATDKEHLDRVNRAVKTAHFVPFSEICEFRGRVVSICRNPRHPAKGTGIALCSEQTCPFMQDEADQIK